MFNFKLFGSHHYCTGLHIEKAYTSLGTFSHNGYIPESRRASSCIYAVSLAKPTPLRPGLTIVVPCPVGSVYFHHLGQCNTMPFYFSPRSLFLICISVFCFHYHLKPLSLFHDPSMHVY